MTQTYQNQFLNAQEYANVMLLLLKNQLVMGKLVDGQFKDEVTDENGLTINIKRPPRFIDKKDGTANLALQDVVTGTAPLTVDQYSKVHISIGDIEYVQSYNALMQNETMKSAASTLAHSVDKYLAGQFTKFNSWVAGATTTSETSGNATNPTYPIGSPLALMAAHTRLMAHGVPNADLQGVANYLDGEKVRGQMITQYLPTLNVTALEKARLPVTSEIDWYSTQQCPVYTTGTRIQGDGSSTGFQVNGASQNVNYRDVKGTAGSKGMTQTFNLKGASQAGLTVVAGDVFTIAGVYAWDWRNQVALPDLQQFTVLVGGTAAATTGDLTVTISPAIIVQGTVDGEGGTDTNSAFGTVDSAPADGAYVEFVGAASTKVQVRAAFHKRAISLVSTRLRMPFTGVASFAVDPDTGIAIRYWRGSDISTGAHIHRWDMMYGADVLDPYLGTRICGQA